jgi:hypothetical protein
MKITGILNKVNEAVTNKNFTSKRIWIDLPGEYPQQPEFQVSGGNIGIFDAIPEGSEVEIEFSIRGNQSDYNGKTSRFNTLSAYKVTVIKAAHGKPQPPPTPTTFTPQPVAEDDGMPF